MPDVVMPRLSDSMEEGTVVAWLADDGSSVSAGQEIVEIETDKATMTHAADTDGVLRIVAAAGQTLPLGAPIARIETDDESSSAPADSNAPPTGTPPSTKASPTDAPTTDAPTPTEASPSAGTGSDDGSVPAPTTADASVDPPRPVATPVARRIAREHGIALEQLVGSGPNGRITKRDVLDVATASPPPSAGTPAAADDRADVVREPTRIERLVAQRMVQSRTETPEFTVSVAVDMSAALRFRAELEQAADASGAVVPSVNDLIVKACAGALRAHPRVNRAWREDRIVSFGRVNVGVAVATDDGGLVVPVIADADRCSLGELAATSREAIRRARGGGARPDELSGGTFTVSNLGMLGVDAFTAIITPGQGAILSVGAATPRWVDGPDGPEGPPVRRPVATLTLNCDHRVIYGADAARFVDALRRLLEHPAGLAL